MSTTDIDAGAPSPAVDADGLRNEMRRIHKELKETGESQVNYREVGGRNVARSLITVAAHPLDGKVKAKYVKGKGVLKATMEKKSSPPPKKDDKDKPKAKPASKDERVKVTSDTET